MIVQAANESGPLAISTCPKENWKNYRPAKNTESESRFPQDCRDAPPAHARGRNDRGVNLKCLSRHRGIDRWKKGESEDSPLRGKYERANLKIRHYNGKYESTGLRLRRGSGSDTPHQALVGGAGVAHQQQDENHADEDRKSVV